MVLKRASVVLHASVSMSALSASVNACWLVDLRTESTCSKERSVGQHSAMERCDSGLQKTNNHGRVIRAGLTDLVEGGFHHPRKRKRAFD